jgi:hypothetical protein
MPLAADWAATNTARRNAAITKNGLIPNLKRIATMTKFRVSVSDMPERSYFIMVVTRAALFAAAMVLTWIK